MTEENVSLVDGLSIPTRTGVDSRGRASPSSFASVPKDKADYL